MDKDLPKLLTEGVPTGILSSIPASSCIRCLGCSRRL
jgi:hypothetical protein